MEDNRTELQKEFEKQTPTIKGCGRVEYLQNFVSWLHLQVERLEGEKLPIHNVNGCASNEDYHDEDYWEGEPNQECEKCGRTYDDIGYDYQYCKACGWDAVNNKWVMLTWTVGGFSIAVNGYCKNSKTPFCAAGIDST